ncbi:hypothetical protein BOX15_Mlig014239g9 [Macrostomum lignano]|uniref:DUF572 domain-containing protein n=3 Tax=Macrostomum lignano TaxID=282301 RepID=A0A267DET9_9PLAT|nr:hypothetical protein BOX15_Mlig014239g17 [Macrostomum lignano]PAA47735.1 hypothetical protein BOX15_Mlig014239g9 [Macrostomum lignano]
MGERKGTNKYYPPDFDPRVHRSLDAYHGTHALRERAKKIGQGVIVIRFEMPYNIWCGGCGRHVAMGVRYNAEKKKVGMYYSTPVYEFNMKCHLCDQRYLIRTDPANFDYVIVSGARRKEQRWDPTENGQIAPEDGETKRRLATDAMYKLEHGKSDEQRGEESAPRLAALAVDAGARGAADIQLNRLVRAGLRQERKRLAAQSASDAELLARHSLTGGSLELLPESSADEVGAQLLRMGGVAPVDAVRPTKRVASADANSEEEYKKSGCSAFKSARAAEPEELKRRTGQNRRMMGVVVGGTFRRNRSRDDASVTSWKVDVDASAASSTADASASTVDASATSSKMDASATSSKVNASAMSSIVDVSATSSTVGASATSSMVGASATSSTVGASATSSMVGASATSSTVGASATSLTADALAISSMMNASPTAPVVRNAQAAGEDDAFGGCLVQYSATPSPASSADHQNN